jgi:hypothetical protein
MRRTMGYNNCSGWGRPDEFGIRVMIEIMYSIKIGYRKTGGMI